MIPITVKAIVNKSQIDPLSEPYTMWVRPDAIRAFYDAPKNMGTGTVALVYPIETEGMTFLIAESVETLRGFIKSF